MTSEERQKKYIKVELTQNFHPRPDQAPASCFGWGWGAEVQQETELFSLFEPLWINTDLEDKYVSMFKYMFFRNKNLTCAPFESSVWHKNLLRADWCSSSSLWLLKLFHGLSVICSVLYSRAEEWSPRWLPLYQNLSRSLATLNILVSIWLVLLIVFNLT